MEKINEKSVAIQTAKDKSKSDPGVVYYVIQCHKSKGFYVCTDGMIRNFETLIGSSENGDWEKE